MSTLQVVSNGRAYLGIGRGDSSLAHLGYSPSSTRVFEDYSGNLKSYLNGEEVEFASDADVDLLNLGDQPDASRIQWAIDIAREARQNAEMEGDIPISAYVNLVVHDVGELAWKMASPAITSQARFMAMHGKVNGPVSDEAREILSRIHSSYNMKKHGAHGNDFITSDFAHEFGIYGPSSYYVDRISQLTELGVDRIILAGGPDLAMPQTGIAEMAQRFVAEVLPKFK